MRSKSFLSSQRQRQAVNFASSPLLASPTPLWRSRVILVGLVVAFIGLAARAAYVQIVNQKFFQQQGEMRFARTLDVPAARGRLLDRNGQVLAGNVPAASVWAIPDDLSASLTAHPDKLAPLAQLLGLSEQDLLQKIAPKPDQKKRNFVWLKRQIDGALGKDIEALKVAGVYLRIETRRHYPEAEATRQLIGFSDIDGQGTSGLELTFNQDLSGKSGSRFVIKDRLGRVVEDGGEPVAPIDGQDVQLTIDSKIQFVAYQKLKEAVLEQRAKSGTVVVLDAQSNEVLAMATYDTAQDKNSQLRNRVLTDSFEPGSVMKPLTISLALERGIVTPATTFQTAPGYINITGAKITDSHVHGLLSVEQIIAKSSNVGTVKIAQQLSYKDMWEFYSVLGLGQMPTLPFPGAVRGKLRAYKTWHPVEQATMSYGYGLSVSLFQLAQAYSVIANGGEMVIPRLVQAGDPAPRQRIMSEKNAAAIRHMLHLATSPGGTAPKAQIEGYTVGGKTGTSHKQEGRGYAAKKYRSTFVGMAPIDTPRVVVAVSIDEPSNGKHYGGEVAAPIFSQTVKQALRLLGVAPDLAIKPQIAVSAVEESI